MIKTWPAQLQTVHFSYPQVTRSHWRRRSWHWESGVPILSHKKFHAGVEQIVCQSICAIFSVLESGPFAAGTCVMGRAVPSLRGSPRVTVTGRHPSAAGLFPGGTAGLGKVTQEKRGGFLAPASPLAHSGKAGSNQPFISPGFFLSSHKTWISIILTSQVGWEALFGNAYKVPWLKGSVEGQCFNLLLSVLPMCGGKGLLRGAQWHFGGLQDRPAPLCSHVHQEGCSHIPCHCTAAWTHQETAE